MHHKGFAVFALSLIVASSTLDAKAHKKTSSASCPDPGITNLSSTSNKVSVDKSNYAKAETTDVLKDYIKKISKGTCTRGMGVFMHQRSAMDPADRTILRPNFDTLYSFAVLDLKTSANINLPAITRYQILEIVTGEHWIPLVSDKPGTYQITQGLTGSRYAFAMVRTQVNMQDENDLKNAREAQDKIELVQASQGVYAQEAEFNRDEILSLRAEYNQRRQPEGITSEMIFGKKGEISSEMRNFGVAIGWGGLPKQGAVYPMPKLTESTDPQRLIMKNVPMEEGSFWSVTVYDENGFSTGKYYNINSAFAKENEAGEYIINLGGLENQDNFLNVYPGWNAVIRIYSPTKDYFSGSWEIPQYEPKNQ